MALEGTLRDFSFADILQLAHTYNGNWAQTFKATSVNPDFYVLRDRHVDEKLPWDFIDQGIKKSYLQQEFQKALKAQPSPACRVETCSICGVCNQEPQSRPS